MRVGGSYNENTANPPMSIVANIRNNLYPNDVTKVGVALLMTKSVR